MSVIRGARVEGRDELVDVIIDSGRIAEISPAATKTAAAELAGSAGAAEILDAEGRHVMAGFIDAHAHAEAAVFDDEVQLAMLRQGITTVISGNDGVSFAPAPGRVGQWATNYFTAINGHHPDGAYDNLGQLHSHYGRRTRINTAALVPHGNLRMMVVGSEDRAASDSEIALMCEILDQNLDQFGCGMSTGLEYQPGGYGNVRELTALGRVLAARSLPHVSHMRGYEDKAPTAMAELSQISQASGVATHISHLHGPTGEVTAALEEMKERGVDVTFDSYPYLRGASILSMVALPSWLPLADPIEAVEQLRSAQVRARLLNEHLPNLAQVWPRVTMAHVPGELNWSEGMTLPQVAQRLGLSQAEAVLELLISTQLRAGCVFAQPPTNSLEAVRTLMRRSEHMASSDAIYFGGRPHPRGWGAFARFLAEHVRKYGDWSWAEAQWHLSTASARRFRLSGRGLVAQGAAADLILLDRESVQDNATYENPKNLATGIDDVFVNGTQVLKAGRLTSSLAGRAIKPAGSQRSGDQ